MKRFIATICGVLTVLLIVLAARALIMTDSTGRWPTDWPKSLDPLRKHARTLDIAEGNQEAIYEITFSDREEFEKAWPTILSLKTPGAPLRLYKIGPLPASGLGALESNAAPAVRIYAPAADVAASNGNTKPSPPWPKELYGPNGELPEYVVEETKDGKTRWVARDTTKEPRGFEFRARIDLDLVIDGKIIDLNRIALPKNTPIEDHRF